MELAIDLRVDMQLIRRGLHDVRSDLREAMADLEGVKARLSKIEDYGWHLEKHMSELVHEEREETQKLLMQMRQNRHEQRREAEEAAARLEEMRNQMKRQFDTYLETLQRWR